MRRTTTVVATAACTCLLGGLLSPAYATPTTEATDGSGGSIGTVVEQTVEGLIGPSLPSAEHAYDSNGEYLNYADTAPIENKSRMKLDDQGVIMVEDGDGSYYHNIVTVAQYGLQQWSRWQRDGEQKYLHNAVVQANWLVKNQDAKRGVWTYDSSWAVAGFDETLPAGWSSAMAQGQAMSLLTRIAGQYPDKHLYATAAKRAHRPFTKTVEDGGLVATHRGGPYYEEYPTSTPSLTLNGFQFSLVGLYDLWQSGFEPARELFTDGYATMVKSLPDHDARPSTAYHLGHLTKPPRKKVVNDVYHPIHVRLLYTLNSVRPNAITKKWADRWSNYPAMDPQHGQDGDSGQGGQGGQGAQDSHSSRHAPSAPGSGDLALGF